MHAKKTKKSEITEQIITLDVNPELLPITKIQSFSISAKQFNTVLQERIQSVESLNNNRQFDQYFPPPPPPPPSSSQPRPADHQFQKNPPVQPPPPQPYSRLSCDPQITLLTDQLGYVVQELRQLQQVIAVLQTQPIQSPYIVPQPPHVHSTCLQPSIPQCPVLQYPHLFLNHYNQPPNQCNPNPPTQYNPHSSQYNPNLPYPPADKPPPFPQPPQFPKSQSYATPPPQPSHLQPIVPQPPLTQTNSSQPKYFKSSFIYPPPSTQPNPHHNFSSFQVDMPLIS